MAEAGDTDMSDTVYECPCTESSNNVNDFFSLTCGCVRCTSCLKVEVDIGLERKSWPPQCIECNVPFIFDNIKTALDLSQRAKWIRVTDEFSDESPTYCVKPDCGQYLASKERYVKCLTCKDQTCTTCNTLKSWHLAGDKCPDIIEPESLREMREKGFKPCPWCKQMIERIDGCDHMSCDQCGKNFCFNCGKKKDRSELPCNCRGDLAWLDEAFEEMDPETQQDILDRIMNGINLPDGVNNVRDLDLLPFGQFLGVGRRVGEPGEPLEEQAPGPDRPHRPQQQPNEQGFNHWRALQEPDPDSDDEDADDWQRRFHPAFPGRGNRLGEAPPPQPVANRRPHETLESALPHLNVRGNSLPGRAAAQPDQTVSDRQDDADSSEATAVENLSADNASWAQDDGGNQEHRQRQPGQLSRCRNGDLDAVDLDDMEDSDHESSDDGASTQPVTSDEGEYGRRRRPRESERHHPIHGTGRRLGDASPTVAAALASVQEGSAPRPPATIRRLRGFGVVQERAPRPHVWARMGQGHRLGD